MSSDQVLRLLISGEMAVDRVAQAAFQRPPGLRWGFRLAEFALVELASRSFGADLADRDQVQRPIQLTVPGAGEPMTTLLPTGRFDRCGAAGAGVVVAAREPFDRAAVSDDLCGQYGVGARNSARAPDLVIPGQRRGGTIDQWRRS